MAHASSRSDVFRRLMEHIADAAAGALYESASRNNGGGTSKKEEDCGRCGDEKKRIEQARPQGPRQRARQG
jgi:hypothetical protein